MRLLLYRLQQFKAFVYGLVFPLLHRMLPLDSTHFGAPRRVSSTPEYCRRRGLAWKEIFPACVPTYQPPICLNYPAAALTSMLHRKAFPLGVAVLRNARIVSPQGWIVGEHDTFLPDHCISSVQPHRSLIYRARRLRPDRKIPGRTLLLASDHAEINFCHLVTDALPRTHLFEASGICSWDEVDQIVTHSFITPGRQQLLELSGLPQEKLMSITDFRVAECETLIAPTFPGVDRSHPAWVVQYWRSKLPRPGNTRRRIYVSRKRGSRGLLNEEEVLPVIRAFGFEVLDPGNSCQHLSFQEAEIVVGLHGAALAHVVFCRPKSVLIELMSPVYISAHFYTTAAAAGMDYYSILGSIPAGQREPVPGWIPNRDYEISPELLRGLLEKVTRERG